MDKWLKQASSLPFHFHGPSSIYVALLWIIVNQITCSRKVIAIV